MKIIKKKKVESYIPTASMADIAFLLIIFFMVTTTIPVDRTPVDLPVSLQRIEFPEGSAIIAVTAEGLINITEGEEASHPIQDLSELFAFGVTVLEKDPLHAFVIKADDDVRYELIDLVLEQLRHAKVKKVVLLTEQETV
jgi:biopolymer transport protein ExbD